MEMILSKRRQGHNSISAQRCVQAKSTTGDLQMFGLVVSYFIIWQPRSSLLFQITPMDKIFTEKFSTMTQIIQRLWIKDWFIFCKEF